VSASEPSGRLPISPERVVGPYSLGTKRISGAEVTLFLEVNVLGKGDKPSRRSLAESWPLIKLRPSQNCLVSIHSAYLSY
jgi:hypothetical protein